LLNIPLELSFLYFNSNKFHFDNETTSQILELSILSLKFNNERVLK